MMHFSTLRDYRFGGDVKDMRGAPLYGEGGEKIARIQDVVFDNNTGDIRYLVADSGHARSVLLPLEHVSYSPERHAFFSEFSSMRLAQLPVFKEHILEDDDQWQDYQQLYRAVLAEQQSSARRPTQINRATNTSQWIGFARRVKRDLRHIHASQSREKRHIA